MVLTSTPHDCTGPCPAPDPLADRMITFETGLPSRELGIGMAEARAGRPRPDAEALVGLERTLKAAPVPSSLRTVVLLGARDMPADPHDAASSGSASTPSNRGSAAPAAGPGTGRARLCATRPSAPACGRPSRDHGGVPVARRGRSSPRCRSGGAIAATLEAVTGQAVHAVSACRRIETGRSLVIDVVESPAHLDDGLHSTFETERDAVGAVVAFRRTGRCNPAEAAG